MHLVGRVRIPSSGPAASTWSWASRATTGVRRADDADHDRRRVDYACTGRRQWRGPARGVHRDLVSAADWRRSRVDRRQRPDAEPGPASNRRRLPARRLPAVELPPAEGGRSWFPFTRWNYFDGARKFARNAPRDRVNEVDLGVEFARWAELELSAMFSHTFMRTRTGSFPYVATRGAKRLGFQAQWNY